MSARHKARKRALEILFSADVSGQPLVDALEAATLRAAGEPERSSSWGYAEEIVRGIIAQGDAIDGVLRDTSQSWPLERMPAVDRAVLRIATWEIVHNPDVPSAVAISEAAELVNELSTDSSASFVHGILATIAEKAGEVSP
ncbi:MAG: transcription antitermination factor NusB [Pontimonas sp.]